MWTGEGLESDTGVEGAVRSHVREGGVVNDVGVGRVTHVRLGAGSPGLVGCHRLQLGEGMVADFAALVLRE